MKNKNKLEILKTLFRDYNWNSSLKNLDFFFIIAGILEIGDKEEV